MDARFKEPVRRLANVMENFSVVGFGLAVFEAEFYAFFVGLLSLFLSMALTWRLEK